MGSVRPRGVAPHALRSFEISGKTPPKSGSDDVALLGQLHSTSCWTVANAMMTVPTSSCTAPLRILPPEIQSDGSIQRLVNVLRSSEHPTRTPWVDSTYEWLAEDMGGLSVRVEGLGETFRPTSM